MDGEVPLPRAGHGTVFFRLAIGHAEDEHERAGARFCQLHLLEHKFLSHKAAASGDYLVLAIDPMQSAFKFHRMRMWF